ncbi:MAG: PCMD domain-containing protein [Prevotella sp.]|nr:PCMD domain-containing protein [Prevotella sp.]MCM1074831.1 PCMD domain-containing protein [Ruminococcus sp.]
MKILNKFKYTAPALLLLTCGCIKNDLPYPRIQQNILTLAVEGQSANSSINEKELTATVYLDEQVNPREVKFTDFTYTEDAECSKNLLEGTYDLTEPLQLTLSLYQNYTWTITAEQTIERYLTVAGQIGETAIDVPGKRIVLYVPENVNLQEIKISSIKLGPAQMSTMTPDLKAGDIIDCSKPVKIEVEYFDTKETWTLYVDKTKALVTTTQADAWVNVLWVYGNAPEDADNGFEYRQSGTDTWQKVPEQYITREGGTFYACIPHVLPLTSYDVRAYSDENYGNEMTVTTGVAQPLPDASFDQWWLNKKVWCPWPEDGVSFWDTGNTGASTLGQSNVTPSDDTPTGRGQSAQLATRFVGIAGIGKLAAGSLFAGKFAKVDGTNGILDFGRSWSVCPTKLRGYRKYISAPVNYASNELQYMLGEPDSCNIWVALIDSDEPYRIRTNPKNRHLFDVNDPCVIAYGEIASGAATNGWEEFEIELKYKATNRKPKYLLVVSAASKYGDYFTGGAGATLWIDDFSLDYDY